MDMTTQVMSARLARKVMKTAPLSNLRVAETIPGGAVPDDSNDGTDANWGAWVNDSFSPVNHPVGTCAMMRRDLGGVVDGRTRLYGSKNVRIVDASIMPTQISAHLSSTLYGMAEKAADMIKSGL
jgi:choline dehydrogenase